MERVTLTSSFRTHPWIYSMSFHLYHHPHWTFLIFSLDLLFPVSSSNSCLMPCHSLILGKSLTSKALFYSAVLLPGFTWCFMPSFTPWCPFELCFWFTSGFGFLSVRKLECFSSSKPTRQQGVPPCATLVPAALSRLNQTLFCCSRLAHLGYSHLGKFYCPATYATSHDEILS